MNDSFRRLAAGAALLGLSAGAASPLAAQSPLPTPRASLLLPLDNPGAAARAWEALQRDQDAAIGTMTFVHVNTNALYEILRSDGSAPHALWVDLGGEREIVDFVRIERGLRHILFHGNIRGQDGLVTLAMGDSGACAASFPLDSGLFELSYTGVGHVHGLHAVDEAAMARSYEPCGTDAAAGAGTAFEPAGGGGAVLSPTAIPGAPTTTTIDVMEFYTPAARTGAGGTAAIESQIAARVGATTNAAAASGVDHAYRLVYVAQTSYTETGTQTDLDRFRRTNDGYMDEVHTLRNQYGGDLMALIISRSSSFCGIARLVNRARVSENAEAFSVTVRTCFSNLTFQHELGHTMGCQHDRSNAGGSPVYSYSYGYRTPDNRYRTLMAYSPGSRVNKWSGPGVRHNGYTMGNASNDNARSLNNMKTIVRGFRKTKMYEWVSLPGGIAGQRGEPTLTGQGTTNQVVPIRITVDRMRAGAPGVMLVGSAITNVPLFGGTLVPDIALSFGLVGSSSALTIDGSALAGLPTGTLVAFQTFFVDPAAAQGFSASDGLATAIP